MNAIAGDAGLQHYTSGESKDDEQRPLLGPHAPVQRDRRRLGDAEAVLPGAQQALALHRHRAVLDADRPGEADAPERELPDLVGRDLAERLTRGKRAPKRRIWLNSMGIVSRQDKAPEPAATSRGADLPLRRLSFRAMATVCEVQYTAPGGERPGVALRGRGAGLGPRVRGQVLPVPAREPCQPDQRRGGQAMGRGGPGGRGAPRNLRHDPLHDPRDPRPHGPSRSSGSGTGRRTLRRFPTAEAIAGALRLVGWAKVRREPGRVFLPEPGMALDFGGFGKEYAVDIVSLIAKDHGITDALVDFGHDLRASGRPAGAPRLACRP